MDPGYAERRPGQGAAAITATAKSQDHRDRNRSAAVLVAHAWLLLGMPGSSFDQLIVLRCPVDGCSYAHRHVVPTGMWRQPIVRPPRCRPWLRYRIEVTEVRPSAAQPMAGQRRRGAA